jgi:hypothetical protein
MFWAKPSMGPDPGQYDIEDGMADATADPKDSGKLPKARVSTSHDKEARMQNSVFNSTSNRFDLQYSKKNMDVRLLTSNGVPRRKIVSQTMDKRVVMADSKDMGVEN